MVHQAARLRPVRVRDAELRAALPQAAALQVGLLRGVGHRAVLLRDGDVRLQAVVPREGLFQAAQLHAVLLQKAGLRWAVRRQVLRAQRSLRQGSPVQEWWWWWWWQQQRCRQAAFSAVLCPGQAAW